MIPHSDHGKVPRRPVLLLILDGFGISPHSKHNAIALAKTPRLDDYFSRYPHTLLQASGRAVGLPESQMGNSEVGHLTLGSGRIPRQYLVRIDDAIADLSFFNNTALVAAAKNAQHAGRPLHLLGLVSDGGVHSHLQHLLALIELCRLYEVESQVHVITDGRDTLPQSALSFLSTIEESLEKAEGHIGSISGRFYAMDRDQRWDRTQCAWNAFCLGQGERALNAESAILAAYSRGEGDEFIRPTLLPHFQAIVSGDEVVFFNFRNDRVRQLTAALAMAEFKGFTRGTSDLAHVTCMTEYGADFQLPVAFDPVPPSSLLSEEVSNAGLRQFHCAETEKYAHVTFFFNGGREAPFDGEDRYLIPSPKVTSYDQQPEMSASEVADALIKAIQTEKYAFLVANFANGDMVGHTAVQEAVVRAVETLDQEIGRVLDVAVRSGYSVILTADHGNCEEMVDLVTQQPHTQHTLYPVPCLLIDEMYGQLAKNAGLSSVAPAVLTLLGLPIPASMSKSPALLIEGPYEGLHPIWKTKGP
ncbi:2,3-bisphosphoglycerate-independent phosphoglycerate mutase [Gammaproteobacteria bacterium]